MLDRSPALSLLHRTSTDHETMDGHCHLRKRRGVGSCFLPSDHGGRVPQCPFSALVQAASAFGHFSWFSSTPIPFVVSLALSSCAAIEAAWSERREQLPGTFQRLTAGEPLLLISGVDLSPRWRLYRLQGHPQLELGVNISVSFSDWRNFQVDSMWYGSSQLSVGLQNRKTKTSVYRINREWIRRVTTVPETVLNTSES